MTADSDPLLFSAGVSTGQLSQVLDLVSGTDIAELDVTIGATRLSLRRPPVVTTPRVAGGQAVADGGLPVTDDDVPLAIASPLVGIFRASIGPGDLVLTGQPIGRIEALGMPTSVDAPRGGTVDQILVQDGQPVEYGQPLLTLRRAPHAP